MCLINVISSAISVLIIQRFTLHYLGTLMTPFIIMCYFLDVYKYTNTGNNIQSFQH